MAMCTMSRPQGDEIIKSKARDRTQGKETYGIAQINTIVGLGIWLLIWNSGNIFVNSSSPTLEFGSFVSQVLRIVQINRWVGLRLDANSFATGVTIQIDAVNHFVVFLHCNLQKFPKETILKQHHNPQKTSKNSMLKNSIIPEQTLKTM